ncbi:MAG: 50S ribosomal protein L13 [Candidatus Pacebacteria bacterium]|nr:50S ribosomal protein L13 [Candidatus Paceibacterota bacterium]
MESERKIHKIDATGKALGRLSTQIADLLRGKGKVGFAPNKDEGDFVVVENVDKMLLTGRKFKQKIYHHFTGFIGGMKEITMEKMAEKKGMKEILRKAVLGMLPRNKLKPNMIKRLTIR